VDIKRVLGTSVLAAGIAAGAAMGLVPGTAAADPGPPCGPQNCQQNGPERGLPVEQRGIDNGRQDHQPFTYNGHRVDPVFDQHRNGWGFWFFGLWIPL
jgi:hypothetical protein